MKTRVLQLKDLRGAKVFQKLYSGTKTLYMAESTKKTKFEGVEKVIHYVLNYKMEVVKTKKFLRKCS